MGVDFILHITRPMAGGFILAFHEIPPERFMAFVNALHRYRAVSLDEIVERQKRGRPTRGLFAITVDDGVGENVRALAGAMMEKGWPGTFYLPTGYIDTGIPMPFQWLRAIEPLLPARKIELKSGTIDLSRPGSKPALWRAMEHLWRRTAPGSYVPLIMELVEVAAREHDLAPNDIGAPAPITWAEVERLSRSDLISFESHGVSHTAVSGLTEREIEWELGHSARTISEHTGRRCRHFCYPFGCATSIGALAPAIAARCYDSAVTMYMGSVDGANPWMLPRIPLYPKNSMLFAGLKMLLKCTPLRAAVPYRSLPQGLPLPADPGGGQASASSASTST